MIRLLLLIPLLFCARSSLAQVNTEQYRSEQDGGVATTVDVDFGLKKGNVDLLTGGVDVGTTWQGDQSGFLWVVDGSFAAKRTLADYLDAPDTTLLDEDAQYINKILSHLRYNLNLTSHIVLEVFGQIEKNDFLLMDRRLLGGIGPRFTLLNNDHGNLALGVAYMLEHERLNETAIDVDQQQRDTRAHRGTSYLSGGVTLGDTSSFGGTIYVQPRLTEPTDFRLLGEVQLTVGITDLMALGIEFTFRHDSDPPIVAEDTPALVATDMAFGQSLRFSF